MRANVYLVNENVYGFTKTCMHCNEDTDFILDETEYQRLIINNEYIQDVFPLLGKEEREMMISGTHPKCWIEMFGSEDDYSEYEEGENNE
jgi:hypothetical protein